jgi:hypothetical protein
MITECAYCGNLTPPRAVDTKCAYCGYWGSVSLDPLAPKLIGAADQQEEDLDRCRLGCVCSEDNENKG